MHPAFQTLLILQERDGKLDQIAHDLAEIPRLKQKELDRSQAERDQLSHCKAELLENKKNTDRIELDIQTLKTTIERLETQRYETKKNEEFSALGEEITRYQERVLAKEEEELLLWEQAEQLEEQRAQAQQQLDEHLSHIEEDLAKLERRSEVLGEKKAALDQERAELVTALDPHIYQRYQNLRRRNAKPCAEALGGVCKGCNSKLPPGLIQELRDDSRLEECPNCGRLLFLYEP